MPRYILHLTFVALTHFAIASVQAEDQDVKLVEAVKVESRPIERSTSFHGIVRANQQANIHAKRSGRIQKLYPRMEVKKGDMLVEFEANTTSRQLENAQRKTQISFDSYQRAQRLFETGTIAKGHLEKAHDSWLKEKNELANIEEAHANHMYAAPFNGVCGIFNVSEGEFIKEYDALVSCYNPASIFFEVNIPSEYLRDVKVGQKALLNSGVGVVTQVQRKINPVTRMGRAKVLVERSDALPLENVKVEIVTKRKPNALVVPSQTIFTDQGTPHVYRIIDGKAVKTRVTVGIIADKESEILAGLKEGEQLILKGQISMWDTRPVRAKP